MANLASRDSSVRSMLRVVFSSIKEMSMFPVLIISAFFIPLDASHFYPADASLLRTVHFDKRKVVHL